MNGDAKLPEVPRPSRAVEDTPPGSTEANTQAERDFVPRTMNITFVLVAVTVLVLGGTGHYHLVAPFLLGSGLGVVLLYGWEWMARRAFAKDTVLAIKGVPSAQNENSRKKFGGPAAVLLFALIKYPAVGLLIWWVVRNFSQIEIAAFVGGFILLQIIIGLRGIGSYLSPATRKSKHRSRTLPQLSGQKYIQVAQGETGSVPETHETVGVAEHGAAEAPESPLAENPAYWYSLVALLVVAVVLGFGFFGTTKGQKKRGPSKRQTLLEQCVASMRHFCRNAIGPGGERFAPLVGSVFAFVLVSNLMGVLPTVIVNNHGSTPAHPDLRHLLPAPTANLSMTIAVSLWVFFVVNWAGIKENGVGGWLKHFAGPLPAISWLIFPIELIGALVKPVSLSIRLFGNVFGEETVIAVLASLAVATVAGFIPFQYPMLVFGVFGGVVQAGVYTILTCAYISLSIGDHDHSHGHDRDEILDEYGADVAPNHAHAHGH